MPHKYVEWDKWIEDIAAVDPCLGRIVIEAVVARDAAEKAGAAHGESPKKCRKAFESADRTLDSVRLGVVSPNTDAAWKRATDALRKFTAVLDCVGKPALDGASRALRRRRRVS